MGHRNKLKGLILTASSGTGGIEEILKLSSPNFIDYADKHNYDFFIETEAIDFTRPFPWSKVLSIKKHLPHYDWVFWIDTDCLILDYDTRLEDFIDGTDMVMSFFFIGDGFPNHPYILHTGCWGVRNTEWAADFLDEVYNAEDIHQNGDFEEPVITHMYRASEEVRKKIKVMKLSKLCSPYWQYKHGDFIVHFCRMTQEKKIVYMNNFLKGNRTLMNEDKHFIEILRDL